MSILSSSSKLIAGSVRSCFEYKKYDGLPLSTIIYLHIFLLLRVPTSKIIKRQNYVNKCFKLQIFFCIFLEILTICEDIDNIF